MTVPLLLALAACGGEEATLHGTLADGAGASHVWVVGGAGAAPIDADTFHLRGLAGDPLDLRFAAAENEVARMEIRGLQRGARVRLHDVWIADGLAFPTRVTLEGGDGPLTVNGLRMGIGGGLPAEVRTDATVLARGAGALLVRPVDEELPDLRVVVTPGTDVRSPDGDPTELERLRFGDSLQVSGLGEDGYVVATELVLSRTATTGLAPRSDAADPAPEGAARGSAVESSSGAGAVSGSRQNGTGDQGRAERAGKKDRDKGPPPGRGKGKGKGKGKGS